MGREWGTSRWEVDQAERRPFDAIRAYLRYYGIPTHVPADDCGGCHIAKVIYDLRNTCKGDTTVFQFFLNRIMEVS